MSEVSSEAVEAAARALWGTDDLPAEGWDQLRDYQRDEWREWATAALTAALPYLAAHQPAHVVPSADVLAEHWQAFRDHRPVGANLPVGQMDGDCKSCHTPWPCPPILALFASQPTVAQVREQVAEEVWDEILRYGRDPNRGVGWEDLRNALIPVLNGIVRGETKGGE